MKTVTFVPYAAMSQIDSTTPVIAIANPRSGYAYSKPFDTILTLEFVDDDWRSNQPLFTVAHAKQVMEFVTSLPDSHNLVVHCGEGMCRSPAIAQALADFAGYTFNLDHPQCPKNTIHKTIRAYDLMAMVIMDEYPHLET